MLSGMASRSRADVTLPESLLGLLLIVVVLAAYSPAIGGGLVWDDDAHITTAALQGWDGLRRIWFSLGATQQYYPVLHSAFWLEHRLWGEAEAGYHLANMSMHALGACLVVLVGQRLAIRGAWIAAFVFALHPVNVESVAWISEQKNTLSLVFYLAAALAWLRFDETRAARHWMLAFALFALALGTKTVTATLPCVLLVVVWWQRGRISWRRDVAPLLPWLALGIAAGLATAWVERHVIGAVGAEFVLTPVQRVLVAGRAVWHYLATFLWPTQLIFTYPRWSVDAHSLLSWTYPVAMLALTAVLWRLRHRVRAPLAAWLAFTGTLFPVMGFLNVYPFRYAFVADHFQYHASIPLAMLVGAGVAWLHERATSLGGRSSVSRVAPRIVQFAAGVMLLTLGALTYRQAGTYRDAETLYRATLAANPDSWMAHHNLGRLVSRKPGGLDEAIAHFEAAIRLKPDHARAQYSLGVALQRVGRATDAVPHFEAAIRLEPDNPLLVANSHYILGDILRRDPARTDDAIAHLREAIRRKPTVAEAYNTIGETLLSAGRPDEARREFEEALRLQPNYDAARRNLALVTRHPATPKGASLPKRP
jgi:Flp pilus assembly protein TadD